MKNHTLSNIVKDRGLWALGVIVIHGILAIPVAAVTYPAVNSTNFPSGTYDDGNTVPMQYRYFVPVGYDAEGSTLYPLVLFLHGAGEKGTDNAEQLSSNANGAMIFISSASPDNQTNHPCFWVAPQLSELPGSPSDWGDSYAPDQVYGIVEYFVQNYNIDPDRVYLTGLSMGGNGVWNQLSTHPNRYAAANPIAGWSDGGFSGMRHIPIWAFASAGDTSPVGVTPTDNAIINLHGGSAYADPIYTRYNTLTHTQTWVAAYDPSVPLVEWMFAQHRGYTDQSTVARVYVSSPTTDQTWLTTGSPISFNGTATNISLSSVDWTNLRPNPDDTGTATGTTSWSFSAPLYSQTNTYRITATGTSFKSPENGATTFSRTILVRNATSDTTNPSVTITAPTTSATYTATEPALSLAGTASDNIQVFQVKWSNSLGGQGIASGTTSWAADGIDIWPGTNVIAVTAIDLADNTSTDVITVTYGSANTAPSVNAGADASVVRASGADYTMVATVTDDGLPGAYTLEWTQISGPTGGVATFSNDAVEDPTVDFSKAGTYVLRLTADDGALVSYDEVTLTVSNPTVGIITPSAWGQATGSNFCSAAGAFNEQPTWSGTAPIGSASNPYAWTLTSYQNAYWYIDFGPNYANIRITETWTRYGPWAISPQGGFGTMWWDDDIDTTNDGSTETGLNWGNAVFTPVGTQEWRQNVDANNSPITPQGRYLIIGTGASPSNYANEFAIIGYILQ